MTIPKEQYLKNLSDAVVEMDEEKTVKTSIEALENRVDAYEAIIYGLSAGMERAGRLYEEEEYFIPELLLCSDAMYAGLNILKPHLKTNEEGSKEKIIIGVVEGDTHDIGKNLVKIMLETSDFEVIDLGRDVPVHQFVEKAVEVEAKIIALSTLMTSTMKNMANVIEILTERNIRDRFKIIVGGEPISQAFADKIGADGYAADASGAVRVAKELAGRVPK